MSIRITTTSLYTTTTATRAAAPPTISTPIINGIMTPFHANIASTNNTDTINTPSTTTSNALTRYMPRPFVNIAVPAFIAPAKALRYIAAGWRVKYAQPKKSVGAVTVSKLFGALIPGHANHAIANDDAEGTLRTCIHRYGDLKKTVSSTPVEPPTTSANDVPEPIQAISEETTVQNQATVNEELPVERQDTVLTEQDTFESQVCSATSTTTGDSVVEEASAGPHETASLASITILEADEFGFMAELIDDMETSTTAAGADPPITPTHHTTHSPVTSSLFGGDKLQSEAFTFSAPAALSMTDPHQYPTNTIFGDNKLEHADFTFTAPRPLVDEPAQVSNSFGTAAMEAAAFTSSTGASIFSCGRVSPTSNMDSSASSVGDDDTDAARKMEAAVIVEMWKIVNDARSQMRHDDCESKKNEEEKTQESESQEKKSKKGGKSGKKNGGKKKAAEANKAAVWGGRKKGGKRGKKKN
ncbi:hypothetical protein GTA08_BOTSDO14304 [Botryosphaeria dothidea]|uniref:Uncharacterized protein n=1 Tax=Botryosphaeria dothidea TaxID=55169 RepID=A0A8H4IIY5_9PEZI|nr:hypothetical protein GTA08_BOTSDO14304 [Botryosphaeria dothidea]